LDIFNAVVLDLIALEREGDVIDRKLIRDSLSILESVHESNGKNEVRQLYFTVFESRFLETSRDFYRKECALLAKKSDAGIRLQHAKQRLVEEQARCRTTIPLITADKIIQVVKEEFMVAQLE
jgi:cullin 3